MTKCNRCKHEWQTKSKLWLVSCPGCGKKIKLREFKEGVGSVPQGSTVSDQSQSTE